MNTSNPTPHEEPVLTPEILAIPLPEGYQWEVYASEPSVNQDSWITLNQYDPQLWAIRYVDCYGRSWYPYGEFVPCSKYEACKLLATAIWMDMKYDNKDFCIEATK